MKYAIISTVSSDKLDYKMAADAATQPRLAQLSIIAANGEIGPHAIYTVKPDGWQVAEEAAAATGLTDERLASGVPVADACSAYLHLIASDYVIVAYGTPWHMKLMRGEMRRANLPDHYWTTQSIDLMRPLIDVCRLPNPSGRRGFKFPKMTEALAHFGIECPPVRDAAENARLSLGLFRALVDMGRLPAPSLPEQ